MKLHSTQKAAYIVAFLCLFLSQGYGLSEQLQCTSLTDNTIQLIFERPLNSGELLVTSHERTILSIRMNGGATAYQLSKDYFPVSVTEVDSQRQWEIIKDCTIEVKKIPKSH
ncbi:hypothetical protein BSZ05_20535 [Vibrio mediterranei]|uniref:Uncharacterized protein n=1 Tax=Vibrio mediterranei TaxID=689 RepID=A0AAN1FK96_9VIBR|nr:hypothetical protein BSZ05_20535 [Vibrio mediterranei]